MIEIITQWMQAHPLQGVIIASILISFFISLVNYLVLDKEKMRELRKRQKEIQEEMKNHKDNPTKMMELQKEMFAHIGTSFKHSMKPMLITFIPIILIFTAMALFLTEDLD